MSLVFWLLVAAMLGVALMFLLPTILRGSGDMVDSSEQENLALARERLKELEQERAAGQLSSDAFAQAKQELEQRLATDLSSVDQTHYASSKGRALVGLLVIMVPLVSILLYQYLGEPEVLASETPAQTSMPKGHAGMTEGGQLPSVDSMVAGLAARLEQQPDDPDGWYMLARSYMSLDRYAEAVSAYERLQQLVGDDPDVLVGYADALAMTRQGDMSGKPIELIEQALTLQPDNATGLWLAGMAYRQQGRLEDAVASWQKARTSLADDAASVAELETLISDAQRQLGVTETEQASKPELLPQIMPAKIEVAVALDDSLAVQVSPEDTVFVLARAINGPPMPLAVVRKQVKDLPLTVVLDDSQAMMPAMKLSRFNEVAVVARVSPSGKPLAQSGDLEGIFEPVKPMQQPSLKVTINSRVP